MTDPRRIAVLSRWHVRADEYPKAVNDHPGARIEEAVQRSEMMHAAYRSHAERRTVDFANLRT